MAEEQRHRCDMVDALAAAALVDQLVEQLVGQLVGQLVDLLPGQLPFLNPISYFLLYRAHGSVAESML